RHADAEGRGLPEAHGHGQLLLPRDDDVHAAAPQRRRARQARLPRTADGVTLPIHDLPLFMAAGLLLNLTPGPDMLFVVGSSAAPGRRAGVVAALGVGAGCLLHMVLAAAGLSALLAASALAFEVVKWVGAAYLVWIGIGMLRGAGSAPPTPSARPV